MIFCMTYQYPRHPLYYIHLLISSLTSLRAEKMYVMFTGCLSTFCMGKSYKRYINCRFGYLVKNGYLLGRTNIPVVGAPGTASPHSQKTSSSFLSSSALFAYWLRSSVVSVLFSLISESFRPGNTLIIPIFGTRDLAPVLAHALLHSVIGLTLHPIDANSFFINCSACPGAWRRWLLFYYVKQNFFISSLFNDSSMGHVCFGASYVNKFPWHGNLQATAPPPTAET
ncbi:hypothetical protein ACN38_g10535 [Penicillium nordicum]|uniref:Uncharacterized protein n=1 Tax=Penicillium nordicum TaxID=229535 RepID=A0A0M8NWA2_9EURO|nr:hypothetical protein ACN38_g10535 [Penicillium nordicum]